MSTSGLNTWVSLVWTVMHQRSSLVKRSHVSSVCMPGQLLSSLSDLKLKLALIQRVGHGATIVGWDLTGVNLISQC